MRARGSQREGTFLVWAANTNGSRREQPPRSSCPSSRDIAGHREAKGKRNSKVLWPETDSLPSDGSGRGCPFTVTIGDLLVKDVGTNSLDRWS